MLSGDLSQLYRARLVAVVFAAVALMVVRPLVLGLLVVAVLLAVVFVAVAVVFVAMAVVTAGRAAVTAVAVVVRLVVVRRALVELVATDIALLVVPDTPLVSISIARVLVVAAGGGHGHQSSKQNQLKQLMGLCQISGAHKQRHTY